MPRLPGGSREPTQREIDRDERKAKLLALVSGADQGEETPIVTEPEGETPTEEAPVEEPAVAEPEEEEEVASEPIVAETPPRKSKGGSIREALAAQEERHRAEVAERDRREAERLAAFEARLIEKLTPKPPPEELNPEIEAWNGAFQESTDQFITPELRAIKQAQFDQKLEIGQAFAAVTRPDYFEVVKIGDPNNAVERYLAENADKAREIGRKSVKDIGVALYDLGMELRERDPAAKEAWKQAERDKMKAELRAELMAEFKGVIAKKQDPVKPGSMVAGANGAGAPANTPFRIKGAKREQLLAISMGQAIPGEDE